MNILPLIIATTTSPFSFKEILWDSGWIWLLLLIMGVGLVFDIIRDIKRKYMK